ncbi:MerR family transcriptional regulator [Paracoccus lutimaris]|uniref:MerR-like DNA binding protein n=1 Tax=Paracoccus lutimaris TaxID=1490030 RepID=A0A368YYT5_9RHOB|nr:MerR family transcriptional regulator [Paracoccus lutimaris]RCW84137.1 MerR-like DNA binding protein [Paracoccus lutimaris]
MSKSPDAFRSIGEVSRLVGVAPHVLRYWESQFAQLSPVKRADGRRYYRPDDVRLAAGLCQVLREEGLSIRGAKRLISADRGAALRNVGAARLGDTLGETTEAAAPAPVIRLASPAPEAPKAAPAPRPQAEKPAAAPSGAAARRRKPAETAGTLPLFPEFDRKPAPSWLARLVSSVTTLRALELHGNPLPEQAKALRDGLRDAR